LWGEGEVGSSQGLRQIPNDELRATGNKRLKQRGKTLIRRRRKIRLKYASACLRVHKRPKMKIQKRSGEGVQKRDATAQVQTSEQIRKEVSYLTNMEKRKKKKKKKKEGEIRGRGELEFGGYNIRKRGEKNEEASADLVIGKKKTRNKR